MKKVIVVGLGIVGAVTSYELARRGVQVVMVDSQEKGRSTYAAAGMLNPWTTRRRNKAWFKLAAAGAKRYDEMIQNLKADGETDVGFAKVGVLHLFEDEAKLDELAGLILKRREAEKAHDVIGEVERLDIEEAYERFPYTDKRFKGLFISGIARVDGHKLTESLINAAKKHHAERIDGKAELIVENRSTKGVIVNGTNIFADAVILTNGIWMPETVKKLGIQLPVTIKKGEIVHLKTDVATDSMPIVIPPSHKYILPFQHGKLIVGTTFQRVDYSDKSIKPGAQGIHDILGRFLEAAPKLAHAKLLDIRTGFRPYTPNSLPLFGPLPGVENLYAANGLGASGFSTGPMIGFKLAKLLANESLDINIDDYAFAKIIADQ